MRIILITGANGGLGQAIARAFLSGSVEDYVWLGVHERRDRAEALAGEFPGRCELLALDVTKSESWARAVQTILSRHERLDVLVNNAGKHEDHLLASMPESSWERVRATNLDATFHGCQAVMNPMIAQRAGRIINVASLSALLAPAGQTNYAAAKAGVVALTQALAKEVARMNITVNAVCPGFIDTDALSALDNDGRKAVQNRIPMRRFGRADEVAAAIRFLACAEASYITGSVLKIDGGIL